MPTTKSDASTVERPVTAVAVRGTDQTAMLLQAAIEKGVDVDALEKLVALHERVTDRAARQEFAEAMADFQDSVPSINKSSKANIVTKSGARYSYTYADLDTIVRTVRPLLHERGFSFTWDSKMDGGLLSVVCTLRHVNGHSESATFASPIDSASPRMSEQQKHAGALTYARRQSLVQVLGLTTTEPDEDGAPVGTITDKQAADLAALIDETKTDLARFLKWAGVESLDAVPADRFQSAVNMLRRKASR